MSLWRRNLDSSHLAEPRALFHVYVAEQLAPLWATVGTLLVDDIGPYFARLTAQGAEVVNPPAERLGGAGFTVRHPDGTVIEYVHHRPLEGES